MDKYLLSVDKCLDWMEREMLSFDRGRVGVYEKFTGTFLTNADSGGSAFAAGPDIDW